MDRVTFLQEMLEVTRAQALVFESMIRDIPDSRLIDFGKFVIERFEPMKSKLLIIKEAIFDFRRMQIENGIRNGSFSFRTIDEMKEYLRTYYRGKEITNGPASYFDYVVIGMDKEGRLVNKYALDEFGRYLVLDGEGVSEVYRWLFENQHRIGKVEFHHPAKSIPSIRDRGTDIIDNKPADSRVVEMIGGVYARVDKS